MLPRSAAALLSTLAFGCATSQNHLQAQESQGLFGVANGQLASYLGTPGKSQDEFQPQSRHERAANYLKGLVSPFTIIFAAGSAGISQWEDVPSPWGQGARGYGHRFGDYLARTGIERTMQWGLESALHEDNRYFQSGKHNAWARLKYAVSGSVLARDDSGARVFSFSRVGSTAATAFLSRTWQPSTDSGPQHGAISFGIGLAGNAGMDVVKEFLPDVLHKLHHQPQ